MSSTISSTLSWCNKGQSVKKIKKDSRASGSGGAAWFFVLIACWMISIQNQVYLFQEVPVLYCKSRLYWNKQSNISKQTMQKKKNHDMTWHALNETRTSVYYTKLQRPIYRSLKGRISLFLSIPLTRFFLPSYTLLVIDQSIKKGIQSSLAIHFFKTCSIFL